MAAAGKPTLGLQRPSAARRSGAVARPLCRRVAMRQSIATCTAASAQWPMRLASAIEQQPAVMLVCQAVVACQRMVSTLRDGFSKAFPQLQDVNKDVSLALYLTGAPAEGVGGIDWSVGRPRLLTAAAAAARLPLFCCCCCFRCRVGDDNPPPDPQPHTPHPNLLPARTPKGPQAAPGARRADDGAAGAAAGARVDRVADSGLRAHV